MTHALGCIAMVTRNNLHLTKLAVNSAMKQEHSCRVMILDNASSDGTVDWLRTKPRLIVVSDQTQRSLAACWNSLLSAAFLRHDRVLVINNDIEIRPDCYHLLMEHDGPFVTGVSVRSKLELALGRQPSTSAPHPDFSCFMIRKDCWLKVGKFNEDFFPAYCEDNDFHVRMHRAGIKAVSIDLPFVHYAAATVKHANPREQESIKRGADSSRSKFFAKYGVLPGTPEYDSLFC